MRTPFVLGIALLMLTASAVAQDAEVGKEYEITIARQDENQYVGAFGQARIGSVVVNVPDAKVKERYRVKVTAIRENQYTGDRQASCDFQQIDGSRKGMCIPAP